MMAGGTWQPRACASEVLKARERKRRLQVSIRAALRAGMCSAGRCCWAVPLSNAALQLANTEERRESVAREGEAKMRR